MVDEIFQNDLENLKKLHVDLEKQMLNFDEIIPFERQRTAEVYSPRLLNMMLVCGAQIEAVTRLILRKCGISDNDEGIRQLIRKINQKKVLSNFKIMSIPHELQFSPFTDDLVWWESYNQLKHDLQEKQFIIKYTTVMDAFAALAGLHCLANQLLLVSNNDISKVLDHKNWIHDSTIVISGGDPHAMSWKSLLFQIRQICNPY
ncbi:MAG: hypothetical protein KGH85_07805 [Thaumarchaeota archaeon]|nr:hypothetical protein [Nitrososphaerota archaeon]